MPDSYNSIMVKCPFYCKDEPPYITCEGVTEGSKIKLWFNSNKKCKNYMREHCFKIKSNCNIANMLNSVKDPENNR